MRCTTKRPLASYTRRKCSSAGGAGEEGGRAGGGCGLGPRPASGGGRGVAARAAKGRSQPGWCCCSAAVLPGGHPWHAAASSPCAAAAVWAAACCAAGLAQARIVFQLPRPGWKWRQPPNRVFPAETHLPSHPCCRCNTGCLAPGAVNAASPLLPARPPPRRSIAAPSCRWRRCTCVARRQTAAALARTHVGAHTHACMHTLLLPSRMRARTHTHTLPPAPCPPHPSWGCPPRP